MNMKEPGYGELAATNKIMAQRLERVTRERNRLRAAIDKLCEMAWEGADIDGGDFQDTLEGFEVLVRVPATRKFREEWDTDEMFVQSWRKTEVEAILKLEAQNPEVPGGAE